MGCLCLHDTLDLLWIHHPTDCDRNVILKGFFSKFQNATFARGIWRKFEEELIESRFGDVRHTWKENLKLFSISLTYCIMSSLTMYLPWLVNCLNTFKMTRQLTSIVRFFFEKIVKPREKISKLVITLKASISNTGWKERAQFWKHVWGFKTVLHPNCWNPSSLC